MKVGNQERLPNCCGVADVGDWFDENDHWGLGSAPNPGSYELKRSGTGLFTATFINNETNKAAYDQLCREHRLLYQSPVKRNEGSGNRLFLCVFEWREPRNRRGERLPVLS